ncbi:hypothetical protein PS1_032621 [Malus domestica]
MTKPIDEKDEGRLMKGYGMGWIKGVGVREGTIKSKDRFRMRKLILAGMGECVDNRESKEKRKRKKKHGLPPTLVVARVGDNTGLIEKTTHTKVRKILTEGENDSHLGHCFLVLDFNIP